MSSEMEFDDWKRLMEGDDAGHEEWGEWPHSIVEDSRDMGSAIPLVDEIEVEAWTGLTMEEIKTLLTKPHVSALDAPKRDRVDSLVRDCKERGVRMKQLAGVMGLTIDASENCRALSRAMKRAGGRPEECSGG